MVPRTGQQWDYPNAWPPLNQMIIEGLGGSAALPGATADDARLLRGLSDDLAARCLDTMLLAWRRTGFVFEKYDATRPGFGGGGGEYTPQIGFGWSIGAAQVLLASAGGVPDGGGGAYAPRLPMLVGGCILALCLLVALSSGWRRRARASRSAAEYAKL